jgi:hypothetical protein
MMKHTINRISKFVAIAVTLPVVFLTAYEEFATRRIESAAYSTYRQIGACVLVICGIAYLLTLQWRKPAAKLPSEIEVGTQM